MFAWEVECFLFYVTWSHVLRYMAEFNTITWSCVVCGAQCCRGCVLHDYLLCVTWHRVVYYMVAGYRVHGPLLWGLSVGIMDCSIHWMAVESRESLLLLHFYN